MPYSYATDGLYNNVFTTDSDDSMYFSHRVYHGHLVGSIKRSQFIWYFTYCNVIETRSLATSRLHSHDKLYCFGVLAQWIEINLLRDYEVNMIEWTPDSNNIDKVSYTDFFVRNTKDISFFCDT